MPASHVGEFRKILDDLCRDRTYSVVSVMWPRSGPAPAFTKTKVKKAISNLQELAEVAFLRTKEAGKFLRDYDHKRQWHPKRGKGHGRSVKKKAFKRWYEKRIETRNCVYSFWGSSGCLYVGRTLNGKGRPSSHFDKHWFGQATRIDVYGFARKRDVPRFECMFTHKHEPSYSRIRPARKKYYSKCPICVGRQDIKDEMTYIFRLR